MPKRKLFAEVLRAAIEDAPVTRYRISQETGISESHLCRFVQGTRGLSLENLEVLCEYLGLQLVKKGK